MNTGKLAVFGVLGAGAIYVFYRAISDPSLFAFDFGELPPLMPAAVDEVAPVQGAASPEETEAKRRADKEAFDRSTASAYDLFHREDVQKVKVSEAEWQATARAICQDTISRSVSKSPTEVDACTLSLRTTGRHTFQDGLTTTLQRPLKSVLSDQQSTGVSERDAVLRSQYFGYYVDHARKELRRITGYGSNLSTGVLLNDAELARAAEDIVIYGEHRTPRGGIIRATTHRMPDKYRRT